MYLGHTLFENSIMRVQSTSMILLQYFETSFSREFLENGSVNLSRVNSFSWKFVRDYVFDPIIDGMWQIFRFALFCHFIRPFWRGWEDYFTFDKARAKVASPKVATKVVGRSRGVKPQNLLLLSRFWSSSPLSTF